MQHLEMYTDNYKYMANQLQNDLKTENRTQAAPHSLKPIKIKENEGMGGIVSQRTQTSGEKVAKLLPKCPEGITRLIAERLWLVPQDQNN